MLFRALIQIFIVSGLVLSIPAGAGAVSFTYELFDVPGASSTSAYAIANNGVIVGSYVTVEPNNTIKQHGFIKDGNNYITVDYPGVGTWTNTVLSIINNNGAIIGSRNDQGHTGIFAFDRNTFTFQNLTYPVGPQDLNDGGIVAGGYSTPFTFQGHGGIYNPATFSLTTVDAPYGSPGSVLHTTLTGINNAGETSGIYWLFGGGTGWRSFIRDAGGGFTHVDVDAVGLDPNNPDHWIMIEDINNLGHYAGATRSMWFNGTDWLAVFHGFYFDGMNYWMFDYPDLMEWTWTQINGMNDSDVMVGSYAGHGLIVTPFAQQPPPPPPAPPAVPEPSTIFLVGAGLAGLGILRGRKARAE